MAPKISYIIISMSTPEIYPHDGCLAVERQAGEHLQIENVKEGSKG